MADATWNCCHLNVFCVHHTTIHHVTSLHARPHTQGACMFSCKLPPALLAEHLKSFTWYCGNTEDETVTKIRVHRKLTLENKFSHCSYWGSNLRPIDHKSGVLTTEQSLLPMLQDYGEDAAWLSDPVSRETTHPEEREGRPHQAGRGAAGIEKEGMDNPQRNARGSGFKPHTFKHFRNSQCVFGRCL